MIAENKFFSKTWLFFFSVACALFVIQPWSVSFFNIPVQVMIVWLLLFLVFISRPVSLFEALGTFTMLQWAMICLMAISVLNREILDGTGMLAFFQTLSGMAIAIGGAIAVKNEKGLTYILFGILIACTISGFVAIMQYMGLADWSWSRTLYAGFRYHRPSGLESYPVAYSYSVLPMLVFGFAAIFLKINGSKYPTNIPIVIYSLCFLFALLGIFLGYSRSGILALVLSFSFLVFGFRILGVRFIPITLFIIFLAFFVISDIAFFGKIKKIEKSVAGDIRMGYSWKLFTPVIFNFPFGVPQTVKKAAKSSYSIAHGKEKKLKDIFRTTMGYDPHNFILTNALNFGITSAIAIVIFYVSIFLYGTRNIFYFNKIHSKEVASVILILLAANLSILVHSWFHNANIGFGEMRNWLWVGMLMGFIRNERAKL